MTFRDDTDALREKLAATEAENRRLREKMMRSIADTEELHRTEQDRLHAEAKAKLAKVWAARWHDLVENVTAFFAAIALGAFVIGMLGLIFFIVDLAHTYMVDQETARATAEHQRLETLRAQVPEHVNPRLWSWCINHCTRYGMTSGSTAAEGVVTEVFADYGNGDGERTRITVRGPWLTGSGASAISVDFDDSGGVTPGTALHEGDLVLVEHDNHGTHVSIMALPSALSR